MGEMRDPRVDPRGGDVLEVKCWFRHVFAAMNGHVSFTSRCGAQWLNSSQRIPLIEWRKWAATAEVVKRGDLTA